MDKPHFPPLLFMYCLFTFSARTVWPCQPAAMHIHKPQAHTFCRARTQQGRTHERADRTDGWKQHNWKQPFRFQMQQHQQWVADYKTTLFAHSEFIVLTLQNVKHLPNSLGSRPQLGRPRHDTHILNWHGGNGILDWHGGNGTRIKLIIREAAPSAPCTGRAPTHQAAEQQ